MSEVTQLLALLDEAFDHKAWHGTTLFGSLRGLNVETAAARPAPGRHNIWETVVHCAYWKYTVRRRLLGEKRGSFALAGSNWFERPVSPASGASQRRSERGSQRSASPRASQEDALGRDLELLVAEHATLRQTVAGLSDAALAQPLGTNGTRAWTIRGIAAHDLYHAGQIQLLKRLVG